MRPASDSMKAALQGSSFELSFSADLYYGDTRLFSNLPLKDVSLRWDGSAEVEGSGRATVLWTDEHGTSLTPHEPQDWLAPFGSRLVVFAQVTTLTSERVQLGVFDIVAVPSADDAPFVFGQTRVNVGSEVQVELQDRMIEVKRDEFTTLAAPAQLTSVYAEIADLTGFQLTRTVADAPITRSVVYERKRVRAVQDLASIIGGTAFMEWDGTLSVRSTTAGAVVAELEVGEQGTVAQVGASLSAEKVYNGIIIRGETADQNAILAELWVTEGPLRATPRGGARTPFHRVPLFYSSPFITTQEQAVAAAPGLLAQYSQPRAALLEVQCLINPLLQVGDVVMVDDGVADWKIRLTKVPLGVSAYMTVLGSVISRVVRG